MLGVSDVGLGGFVKGGVTLKMMDECGGITAMRHCQTFVVTASIEATNFHERVPKGLWIGFWLYCIITVIIVQLSHFIVIELLYVVTQAHC